MDDPTMIDGLNVEYVMSHLVSSEEPDNPLNGRQLEAFSAIRGGFPHVAASLANSSGVFLGPKYHFDLVRPGVALYGANPQPGHLNPMREVVRSGENRSSTLHRRPSNRRIWRRASCFGAHHDRHASIGIRRRLSAVPERPGDFAASEGFECRSWDVSRWTSPPSTSVRCLPSLCFPGAEVAVIGESVPIDDLAERGGHHRL